MHKNNFAREWIKLILRAERTRFVPTPYQLSGHEVCPKSQDTIVLRKIEDGEVSVW